VLIYPLKHLCWGILNNLSSAKFSKVTFGLHPWRKLSCPDYSFLPTTTQTVCG